MESFLQSQSLCQYLCLNLIESSGFLSSLAVWEGVLGMAQGMGELVLPLPLVSMDVYEQYELMGYALFVILFEAVSYFLLCAFLLWLLFVLDVRAFPFSLFS